MINLITKLNKNFRNEKLIKKKKKNQIQANG